ncbi:hypothetical protein FRB94_004085 [Tulasnella sp. JGI-2019a]|nr:hypothetical protein FRB94_004085 [Tulasnella sp. JGI-2019a]
MAFFGFDSSLDKKALEDEDLAVYTWGEDSYDGLGDALDEQRDTLNDETFGGSDPIGKDFDFSAPTLALPPKQQPGPAIIPPSTTSVKASTTSLNKQHSHQYAPQNGHDLDASGSNSLEALWQQPSQSGNHQQSQVGYRVQIQDFRSPVVEQARSYAPAKFSPFDDMALQTTPKSRPRTLQDIEAELRRQHAALSAHQQPQSHPPKHQNEYYDSSHRQLHQTIPNDIASYAPDAGTLTIDDVQRMLQAQHISEPPFAQTNHQQMLSQQQLQQQQYREQLIQMQQLQNQQRQLFLQQQQQQPSQATAAMQHALEQQMFLREQAHHITGASTEHLMRNERQGFRELRAPHQPMRSVDPGPSAMLDQEQRSLLMGEATRKIMEAEMMEEKRRRRAAKLGRMAKHNDLMTQSDKDFITRIQVSQLVTNDPYAEDFYAQVFSSFVRSRLGGPEGGQKSMLKFANGTGVGTGIPGHRGAGRRENAMARMQAQVEKMISNARSREHDKSAGSVNPALQGALGNVSGRVNKAAPRQMLQVSSNGPISSPSFAAALPVKTHEEHHRVAQAAGKLGREAMNVNPSDTVTRKAPLTHRQAQIAVESIYDSLLMIEQMNRDAPPADDIELRGIWNGTHTSLVEEMWSRSMIMVPVETSDPHPFISLLALQKGKRLVPRIIRLLPEAKVTLLLVLFVACFHQMDVVREAHVLDDLQGPASARWKQVSGETDAALVMLPSIISVLGTASLRLLTGLLNIMMGNGLLAVLQIVKSQASLAS